MVDLEIKAVKAARLYIYIQPLGSEAYLLSSLDIHFFQYNFENVFNLNVINKGIATEVDCSGICHYCVILT